MFKRLPLFGLLFCFFQIGFAQLPHQVLRGKVLDKDTQIPLIGASIVLLGTDPMLGTTTDFDGSFRLEEVEVGRYNIRISYLGYEDIYIRQLLIGSGKEVVLNLEMQESVFRLVNGRDVEDLHPDLR